MTTREAPYTRLKRVANNYIRQLQYRRERVSSHVLLSDVNRRSPYRLDDVAESVRTAALLGWDTHLRVVGDKLQFVCVRRVDDSIPWELQ